MNALEIHLLQNIPASNINRGEDGEPKTVVNGGVRRQRVSSQSWKRPIRQMLQASCLKNGDPVGTRSKIFHEMIARELSNRGVEVKDFQPLMASIKFDADSNTLMYLAPNEVSHITEMLADAIKNNITPKDFAKNFGKTLNKIGSEAKDRITLDISLFGRMFASSPELNVYQALFANHAMSTHTIEEEMDYFTAVDDLRNEQGAAHIGNSAFTSSTLYRYFAVDLDQLQKNLGKSPVPSIPMIINSIIKAFPTGKQTTMNANTRPSYARFILKDGQPQQFCDAFENPVTSDGKGFMDTSITLIENEIEKFNKMYGTEDILYSEKMSVEKPLITIINEISEKISFMLKD